MNVWLEGQTEREREVERKKKRRICTSESRQPAVPHASTARRTLMTDSAPQPRRPGKPRPPTSAHAYLERGWVGWGRGGGRREECVCTWMSFTWWNEKWHTKRRRGRNRGERRMKKIPGLAGRCIKTTYFPDVKIQMGNLLFLYFPFSRFFFWVWGGRGTRFSLTQFPCFMARGMLD